MMYSRHLYSCVIQVYFHGFTGTCARAGSIRYNAYVRYNTIIPVNHALGIFIFKELIHILRAPNDIFEHE